MSSTRASQIVPFAVAGFLCLLTIPALSQSDFNNQSVLMLSNSIIHPNKPMLSKVRYCYSNDNLHKMASENDLRVIVHHGKQLEVKGFNAAYSHTERLDFFAAQNVGQEKMTPEIVRAILEGGVTNWSEIGGHNLPITVYVPEQEIKRQAIAAQLRKAGVRLSVVVMPKASYSDLAQALKQDEGAFVIGLRSAVSLDENLREATRYVPKNDNGEAAFAMPIHLYMRQSDPAAKQTAAALFGTVEARAAEDRMNFPLDQKLQFIDRIK